MEVDDSPKMNVFLEGKIQCHFCFSHYHLPRFGRASKHLIRWEKKKVVKVVENSAYVYFLGVVQELEIRNSETEGRLVCY